ncbi:LamG domain-containing protein [Candidatus Palauibacter sp.]|uniref:LamG domain-containing protein n=1 Tax=Candidatus Palauibacter sp. TaxID=3101350 RepID=UPI003D13A29B
MNIGPSSHLSDPDRGALAYEANSSDPAVARVMVTGTLLTVEALSRGIADVTVTARDDRSAEVRQVVEVLGCVRVPDGALHWWTGDGTGADIVGGLDVTLMNGADYAKGHVDSNAEEPFSFGGAFSFDGVDAIGRLPDAPILNPAGPFSVMVRAKARPASVHSGASIAKGHPWAESWVLDTHNGLWRRFIRDRNLRDRRIHGPRLVENEWTHLAMTWDGGRLAFYVDAAEQGTRSVGSIHVTDAFAGIGARSEEGFEDDELAPEFTGEIDEVMFFGRALDPAEIRAVYETTFGLCRLPAG